MIGVSQEYDKVVIDMNGRKRDVLLSCAQAERFEEALIDFAAKAELSTPQLIRGEHWSIRVESFDGMVAIRFNPPYVGNPEKVLIPYQVARELAKLVKLKRQQAEYRMRFVFTNMRA